MSCERRVTQASRSLRAYAALKRANIWVTSVSFGSIGGGGVALAGDGDGARAARGWVPEVLRGDGAVLTSGGGAANSGEPGGDDVSNNVTMTSRRRVSAKITIRVRV